MKKVLFGILFAAVSLPAFAWGAREQGALTGLVVGSMMHNHHHRHGFHSHYIAPPRAYYYNYALPAPVYNYVQPVPQPQVVVIDNTCRRVPVLDQNNQIIAYSQVCQNTQVTE